MGYGVFSAPQRIDLDVNPLPFDRQDFMEYERLGQLGKLAHQVSDLRSLHGAHSPRTALGGEGDRAGF
jgi:hypothetical protein